MLQYEKMKTLLDDPPGVRWCALREGVKPPEFAEEVLSCQPGASGAVFIKHFSATTWPRLRDAATLSSRRRADGVEVDAKIQPHR